MLFLKNSTLDGTKPGILKVYDKIRQPLLSKSSNRLLQYEKENEKEKEAKQMKKLSGLVIEGLIKKRGDGGGGMDGKQKIRKKRKWEKAKTRKRISYLPYRFYTFRH